MLKELMYSAPDYKDRNPEEIVGEKIYFDSIGYLYRAVSWLDYFERTELLAALLYSCIEARMGIEHLLFEELVLSTGLKLSGEDYKRCLDNRKEFTKLIKRLCPDHEKLQQFTRIVWELETEETGLSLSQLVFWSPRELEKAWGKLSNYLHWSGATTETTDKSVWVTNSQNDLKSIILPIWKRMSSGPTGLLHPDNMEPNARDIWNDFRNGKIDINSAKRRLAIIRPVP